MARRLFFWYLILSFLLITVAPRADAFFVTSDRSVSRSEDLNEIRRVLEEKLVSQRLLELGFTPEQVQERIIRLHDDQIHQLAGRLQELRAGGAAEGVLIGFLIIAVVILVILPLAGIRVWFDGKS